MSLLHAIALTKTPLVGSVIAKNLVNYCGSVSAVFEARSKELLSIPNIGKTIADSILSKQGLAIAERELQFIEQNGIEGIHYWSENYPQRLKQNNNAPLVLYQKGNADLNHPRNVAIIGTRKQTDWGKINCEQLVEGLEKYDVQIISGLAYGVDVTAHRKSLDLKIPTVGVLGHGLDRIYPAAHKKTAMEMIECGALLTEFVSNTRPDRENFPMRNRIVAGLCDALVVVETANSGGSMITVQYANAYNKDVFTVPGRLRDSYSQGCNRLIKTHKAALIENAEDIGYVMRWDEKAKVAIQQQLFVELTEQERKIATILKDTDGLRLDSISYQSGFSVSVLSAILLEMEFKGVLRSLPGSRYLMVV